MKNKEKEIGFFAIGLFAGVILGVLLTVVWQTKKKEKEIEISEFEYGVLGNTLAAKDIVWNEYPKSRRVQLTLNGQITITVPRDYHLSVDGLQEADSLREVSRDRKTLSDGRNNIYYDEVIYEFQNAEIISFKARFSGEPIKDAAYGYKLSYTAEDDEIIIGYVLPMSSEFKHCSREESMFWECTQNVDFGLLSLSRTYVDKDILCTKEECPTVKLERKEGSRFDCTIINEGDSQWSYSAGLPGIEVWNQGVWLQWESLYADMLISTSCDGKQTRDIHLSQGAIKSYAYFSPGLYRVVVYGTDGTYAATESFILK